ncbi:NAD-dependent epimerase/dehydratase family protein [Tropicimonas aquimaris]|uniref:NAD-dependent epimerase/dehydratase family protein n=1 Tax=Tropicimonas aquimaris TaxID=914152 RepID=A0ABW3IW99_9RHOB
MKKTKSERLPKAERFLVTGGCGFIGAALCRLLREAGAEVVVLDDLSSGDPTRLPSDVRLIRGDICDRVAVDRALEGATGVFHLAAVASVELCARNPEATRRTNLHGTAALLDAAGDLPFVFTSSAAVYGEQAALPIDETATLAPMSSYATDKLGSEQHLQVAAMERGARCIALRPFNIFGPGQAPRSPYTGVLTRFVESASSGLSLSVNGDGGQTRDFVHVSDVARALRGSMEMACRAEPGHFAAINICSGKGISILELARLVNRLANSRAPISFGPARPGDIRHSTGDPTRAEKAIGFRVEMPFEAGIAEMLAGRADRIAARQGAPG